MSDHVRSQAMIAKRKTTNHWHGLPFVATIVALAFAGPARAANADLTDWELAKSRAGIEVYQKPVAGSAFKATRGSLQSEARLLDILFVIRDVGACKKWLHKCKYGEVVSKQSTGEQVNYTVIDAPFFMKDRDTYIRTVTTYDAQKQVLSIKMIGVENTAPPIPRRVRVLDFEGFWLVEQVNDQQVRLTYQVHMDPQVSPAGAANSMLVTSVFETLKRVNELALTDPYRNSTISQEKLDAITHSPAQP